MGRDLPSYPTLFTKYADTLIGANDAIEKPDETDALDWEAELIVVIGAPVRRATEDQAVDAIAGFTVMNDISVRDWQFRTVEWTQGKIWDSSTPVGPYLDPDEVGVRPALAVSTTVNGEVVQNDDTGTLLFDPVHLVRYVSTVIRLNPGDLIATGTPAGVGHAREPRRYLQPGDQVVTEIHGLGSMPKPGHSAVRRDLEDARRWVTEGTALMLGATAGLDDARLRAPSLLPGWSRNTWSRT